MLRLTIAVPRFKESPRECRPLLASIAGQLGVDFEDVEVLICNDAAGTLPEDFLEQFPELSIRQLELEQNGGPGMTRQLGLDEARGEWVMFCDCDDRLHSVGVLGAMLECAERDAPDIIATEWLEELPDGRGGMRYATHSRESTWMHGKMFRTAFARRVRHHPELRVHEDSYWLSIATSLTDRRVDLPITGYVWCYQPDSITRRDGARYTYDSIPTFVHACALAMEEVERLAPGAMGYKTVQLVLYLYYILHSDEWRGHDNERAAVEDAIRSDLAPYKHHWDGADPVLVAQVAADERAKHFVGLEDETVGEWLAGIWED